jgi:DNA repair exonuclease SbcCD ATPase subunit
MKIKHKLLSDYQYITPDKKIFLIKSGTIIEEYTYKLKDESIYIDKEIVEANPHLFDPVDWKNELLSFIKSEKMPQPAKIAKSLIPFLDEMIMSSLSLQIDNKSTKDLDRKFEDIEDKERELLRKEDDLNYREKKILVIENDITYRLERVDIKEQNLKQQSKEIDSKEELLRDRYNEISSKDLEFNDKLRELNEKERNIDKLSLESSKEIDIKYIDLQNKINQDLEKLNKREIDLENGFKRINELESNKDILTKEVKEKIYEQLELELKSIERDIIDLELILRRLSGIGIFIKGMYKTDYSNLVSLVNKIKNKLDNNILK